MPILLCLLAWLIVFCAVDARAAETCFTPRESDADAALRYHAHLRIVGLTCTGPQGASLFPMYQLFTTNNGSLLQDDAQVLERFYLHEGNGGEDGFHAAETEFQNREALAAAGTGAVRFCRRHAADLNEAVLDSPLEVQRAIALFTLADPASIVRCH